MSNENLTDSLKRWAAGNDDRVRAAVGLLIEHDHWLWDEGFTERCVSGDADASFSWIDFAEVKRYYDDGPPCSTSEAAILLAIADIGSERWQISTMDGRNRARVVRAVAQAAGVTVP